MANVDLSGGHTMSDEDTIAVLPQAPTLTSTLLMLDKELYESRVNDLKKYIGICEFEDKDAVDISNEARCDLASKISNISCTSNTRQHCLRHAQLSDLLFKILNQNRHFGQGSPLAQNISVLLTEQKSIIMQINSIQNEVSKLIDENFAKMEELKRLSSEQIKIMKKIENKDKHRESAQTQNILIKIEKKKERLEAISFLAQRIIFASKIDWSEDTEIKELLFLFSEPIPE